MRPSIVTPAFIAAAALAATAHGCDSNGGGSGGGAIPITAFGTELAKAFCHRVYSCCDAIERGTEPEWGPTEAACVTALEATLSEDIPQAQADIAAGLIIYNGDAARRCFDDLANLSCADYGVDVYIESIPDCRLVAQGTVALGGTCSSSGHCASRLCGINVGAASVCIERTAPEPQPSGSACDDDSACVTNNCPLPTGTEPRTCRPPTMCNGL